MKVLCYGGGTNTTAMIVGLAARNIRPDLIIMAALAQSVLTHTRTLILCKHI